MPVPALARGPIKELISDLPALEPIQDRLNNFRRKARGKILKLRAAPGKGLLSEYGDKVAD